MKIFISREGQQFGPYSVEEINARLRAGELNLHDWAWPEGEPDWVSLGSINGIVGPPTTPAVVSAKSQDPSASPAVPVAVKPQSPKVVSTAPVPVKPQVPSTPPATGAAARSKSELSWKGAICVTALIILLAFSVLRHCTGQMILVLCIAAFGWYLLSGPTEKSEAGKSKPLSWRKLIATVGAILFILLFVADKNLEKQQADRRLDEEAAAYRERLNYARLYDREEYNRLMQAEEIARVLKR
jgi:hypothetical protein